jgi:hypothetical protein
MYEYTRTGVRYTAPEGNHAEPRRLISVGAIDFCQSASRYGACAASSMTARSYSRPRPAVVRSLVELMSVHQSMRPPPGTRMVRSCFDTATSEPSGSSFSMQ